MVKVNMFSHRVQRWQVRQRRKISYDYDFLPTCCTPSTHHDDSLVDATAV
jgi:hypothetical protein